MNTYQQQREAMVKTQIERRGIKDSRILAAFLDVPRHVFVPREYQSLAYQDRPLPIGEGQTISQPYIVALMTELINPQPDHRILEIGTGSGYQAAILSRLAGHVFSIERHQTLIDTAAIQFNKLGYSNIDLMHGDGSQGLPDEAPFDAILLTAAAPKLPTILVNQLKNLGTIIAPIGERTSQMLVRWTKTAEGEIKKEDISAVAFVPLRGKYGWIENDWPENH